MARRTSTRGTCSFCERDFGKGAMTRHLKSCKSRAGDTPSRGGPDVAGGLHLIVEGLDDGDYWMHLAVPADAPLELLDFFLRDTWLECCGHLSVFNIGREGYFSYPTESWVPDMSAGIGPLLAVGSRFTYEYDFGDTTALSLRVVSEVDMPGEDIRMLARNLPPLLTCGLCEASAAKVNTYWDSYDERFICDDCFAKQGLEEDMCLPLVNSPRVGMCGYTG